MLSEFESWTSSFAEYDELANLNDSSLGIDAAEYLRSIPKLQVSGINRKIFEELPMALGGQPFGYKAVIERTIEIFREFNIKPYFVFSGLECAQKDPYPFFTRYEAAMKTHTFAWKSYDDGDGQNAVELFGRSEYAKPEDLFRLLQMVLREQKVPFLVAPFGSAAQLAYMVHENVIDAFWGPSEAFVFDIEDVITKVDFMKNEFTYVRKKRALEWLGNLSQNVFVDAALLAGSDLLPTLPWIETHTRKPTKIQTAVDQILTTPGRSGYMVVLRHSDSAKFQALNYADAFKRARMAIVHHIAMKVNGEAVVLDAIHAPRVHDFMSQRLPDELYFYFSRGLIGPRVLNWRASAEVFEPPPLDNGESEAYRALVSQLTDVRATTIALLSLSLHRFYQHKDLTLRTWYDKESAKTINIRDLVQPKPVAESWKVTADIFGPTMDKLEGVGLIGRAIQSLTDPSFAARTIAPKIGSPLLKTTDEILLNSIWRLLHLRGYINDDHTLSPWGKVLAATLNAIPSADLEEAAIIAVELARYGYLTYDNFFPSYSGITPASGDMTQKNILLLSRVACLGRFRHKQIGFTGALSRQLLGYNSMIAAVRHSLRDLAEVCMVSMLLNYDASRDNRKDWYELGLKLPFLLDNDCGLGLLMNNYLYQLYQDPSSGGDSISQEMKTKAREETKMVFAHCVDADEDLDRAFKLWDAIYAGVKTMGKALGVEKVRKQFEEVQEWQKGVR